MKKIRKVEVNKEVESLEDLICDCCGQDIVLLHEPKANVKNEYSYKDFLTINKRWGYYSNKDDITWEAHICEKCVDTHLSKIILFNKTMNDYRTIEELKTSNKVTDRKRKIRRINGEVEFEIINKREDEEME